MWKWKNEKKRQKIRIGKSENKNISMLERKSSRRKTAKKKKNSNETTGNEKNIRSKES